MDNRNYNIFFHIHTVSGITISVILYVIFFAGSFAFFRDEINSWQRNESAVPDKVLHVDFDKSVKVLDSAYVLQGRHVWFGRLHMERQSIVNLEPTHDSLAPKKARESHYLYQDSKTLKSQTYDESYALGEFLYRLHFLAQIPYPYGYYLAGFTALFFLFAIFTGVLVHWKKIVSNFYVFRPKEKLKTLWTDSHTALGMIGLPFQFVYAVTGAFFLINILLVAPAVLTFYGGDDNKLYTELGYIPKEYPMANKALQTPVSINAFAEKAQKLWKDFDVMELEIQNYGDANMHIIIEGSIPKSEKFTGTGKAVYKAATGELVFQENPYAQTSYVESVKNILYRIHYGDYAGYALKIISFLLGLLTCFVILSGVMLWLVARKKKNMPEKKRRFNERVVKVYLAITLSMFPITALTFIAVKIYPAAAMDFIYSFYFIGWLLLTVGFLIKNDYAFTNKYALLLGSIAGFTIPVINGILTGNWIWVSLKNNIFQVFFIDAFWIILSVIGLFAFIKVHKHQKSKKASV